MSVTRSKIRSRKQLRIEAGYDGNDVDKYVSLLKRAALQCRLFGKKAAIIYRIGIEDSEITTSSWTTKSGQLILKDGTSIPLSTIKRVYVL